MVSEKFDAQKRQPPGLFLLENARESMVRSLQKRGIKDFRLLDAFRTVHRHRFVEEALQDQAYGDYPLPIGDGQTISQPFIVAMMINALELKPDARVLEIGTGSGYLAAVLSRMVSKVYTVERISRLYLRARHIIYQLEYFNIETKLGDGTLGWSMHAPYDGIIVSAGAPALPSALIDQVKLGGKIIVPIGTEWSQELVCYTRTQNKLIQEHLGNCRFVKLLGKDGWSPNDNKLSE